MIKNHKELSVGCFNIIDVNQKQFIMECVAWFHHRDGVLSSDGSLGTIKISLNELNDILAYAIKRGMSSSPNIT